MTGTDGIRPRLQTSCPSPSEFASNVLSQAGATTLVIQEERSDRWFFATC
jgi:hypothetical protein